MATLFTFVLLALVHSSHGQSYLTQPDETYNGVAGNYIGELPCGTSDTQSTSSSAYFNIYYIRNSSISVYVDTCDDYTDYDTGLAIWLYSAYDEDWSLITSDDDSCSAQSVLSTDLERVDSDNEGYFLVVGGFGSSTGNYRVGLSCNGGGVGGGGGSSSSEANNKNMGMQVIIPLTMIFSFFGLVKYFGKIRNIKKKLWENPNQAELINQVNSNSSTATTAAAPATTTTTPGVATAAPIRLNPQPQVKYVYTAQRPVQVVQAQPQTQTRVVYAVAAKPGVTTATPNPNPVYQPPQSSGFQPPSRAQAMANFSPSPGPGAAGPPAYAPTSTPQEAPPAYVPATSDGAPPPYSPGGY